MAYRLYLHIDDGMMNSGEDHLANYLNYDLAKKRFYEEIESFNGDNLTTKNDKSLYYHMLPYEVLCLEKIYFEDDY